MGGIRLGGLTFTVSCGPPFSAFEGTDGDGDGQVYQACNGLAVALTDFAGGGATYEITHNPVLSPDGSKVLFEAGNTSTGYTEIWVADGGIASQVLADGNDYYMQPSWHPDSDQFVCIHGASGAFEGSIEKSSVSNPGTIDVLITQDGTFAPYRPCFNFDGSRVAYIWDEISGSGGDLKACDDDGTNDGVLDTTVRYRFAGQQLSWANSSNVLAYDDGQTLTKAYVINGDGTGKVQINAIDDAYGKACRVSALAWPSADDFVVISVLDVAWQPTRCGTDGSYTTYLDATNGASNGLYFKQVLVYQGRAWYIASSSSIESNSLAGGDHQVNLTIDGAQLSTLGAGDGWYSD